MTQIFSRLPIYLILKILSYTYNTQDKILLEDIQNYHSTKYTVNHMYNKFWIKNNPFPIQYRSNTEDIDWLANDMCNFLNQNIPTMQRYTDKFYKFFQRNPLLNTKTKIDKYINFHFNNDFIMNEKQRQIHIRSQVNIFWGLFTKEERDKFITLSSIAFSIALAFPEEIEN